MTDKEYFCTAPWTSLYLEPDGDVKFCCISKQAIGNVHEESLDSIINGSKVRQIKAKMLANEPIDNCIACWRQVPEKRLQNFFNTRYIDFEKFPELNTDWFANENNFRPKYLDLRWNNTCNFACIYCSPSLSSLWADIEQHEKIGAPIPIKPNRQIKQQILTWTLENIEEVDWIYLAGGEPLMIKENLAVLARLHEVSPECQILVNTNLSHVDGNEVFQNIKKFRNVKWLVSGEAFREQYEYIRWPGKWSEFYKNLKTLKTLENQGHSVVFNLVGMNLNAISMWDYIDFLRRENLLTRDIDIAINLYNSRDSKHQWAIQRLPDAMKNKIRDRISSGSYEKIHGLANYIDALDDPIPIDENGKNSLTDTVEWLKKLDAMRGLDSTSVFPEIYECQKQLL